MPENIWFIAASLTAALPSCGFGYRFHARTGRIQPKTSVKEY